MTIFAIIWCSAACGWKVRPYLDTFSQLPGKGLRERAFRLLQLMSPEGKSGVQVDGVQGEDIEILTRLVED
jgi:hypothetical protein